MTIGEFVASIEELKRALEKLEDRKPAEEELFQNIKALLKEYYKRKSSHRDLTKLYWL